MITECAAYDLIDRLHSPDLTRLQKRTANCQCLTTKEPQDGRLSGQRRRRRVDGHSNRSSGQSSTTIRITATTAKVMATATMVCWLTTLSLSILRPFQQLRQLGDVDGYPPCLIPRHKIRSRPASRLIFVISVSERVPVVVRAVVIDHPRWREAAAGHRLLIEQTMNIVYNEFPKCKPRRGARPRLGWALTV